MDLMQPADSNVQSIERALDAIARNLLAPFATTSWSAWTPAITSSIGVPTTTTINKARFMQIGKTVHCRLDVTVVNKGTAAGHLEFTLPVVALDTSNAGSGGEIAALGVGAEVWTKSTTKGALIIAGGGTGWVNTYQWIVTLTYEAA